ncbi:Hypothetical protein FKW44_005006, partial [Caligus rogercresseyi]
RTALGSSLIHGEGVTLSQHPLPTSCYSFYSPLQSPNDSGDEDEDGFWGRLRMMKLGCEYLGSYGERNPSL